VFVAERYGASMPWAGERWVIQEITGWTLEYIDNLDMADILELHAVKRGQSVARER